MEENSSGGTRAIYILGLHPILPFCPSDWLELGDQISSSSSVNVVKDLTRIQSSKVHLNNGDTH